MQRGVVAGPFWMCTACLSSALAGAMVRELGGAIPAWELAFFRSVLVAATLLPWMLRNKIGLEWTAQYKLYGLRVLFAFGAMILLFSALAAMPVADVFALQYTIPIMTIVMAVLFLGQKATIHTWIACAVGFAGALIIVRPGLIEVSLAAGFALLAALLSACSNTTVKLLARTEAAATITAVTAILMIPLALIPTLLYWVTPTMGQIPVIIGVALFGGVGGYSFTRAISAADARIVQPFQFTRMIFAAGIGFVLFNELPDLWTWIGAAVIFGGSYYVVWREDRASPVKPPVGI